MRKACGIRVKLVKNCGFLFSNLNTFLKSYVVGSSHYIFFFRLFWVPYINTNPFWAILELVVGGDLNFVSSTQCAMKFPRREPYHNNKRVILRWLLGKRGCPAKTQDWPFFRAMMGVEKSVWDISSVVSKKNNFGC